MKIEIKVEYIVKNIHFNDIERFALTLENIENKGSQTPSWIWSDNAQIIAKRRYTGLKDKNDKEIYEGDKLLFSDGKDGIVKFNHQRAGFIIEYQIPPFREQYVKEFNCTYGDGENYIDSTVEVIGNIYEEK